MVKFQQRGTIQLLLLLLLIGALVPIVYLVQKRTDLRSKAEGTIDLELYYWNQPIAKNYYLEQYNPKRLHWFQKQDRWTFRQYNTDPLALNPRHYDQFSVWDDGLLRYIATHNEAGSETKDTVFDPPIILFPKIWSQQKWSISGESRQIDKVNGTEQCRKTNRWHNEVVGWEEIAPGVQGIHIKSHQTTTESNCSYDQGNLPLEWEEHYWLAPMLVEGQPGVSQFGLKRTMGGDMRYWSNPNGGYVHWDIWHDMWKKWPKRGLLRVETGVPATIIIGLTNESTSMVRHGSVDWERLATVRNQYYDSDKHYPIKVVYGDNTLVLDRTVTGYDISAPLVKSNSTTVVKINMQSNPAKKLSEEYFYWDPEP